MEFLDICRQRYATKKFSGEMISDEKIEKLKQIIQLAPSSFGLQPWKIKIVTDQSTKDTLQKASWNQEQVGTASHVFVFCADTRIEQLIDEYGALMLKNGYDEEKAKPYLDMMRNFASNMDAETRKNWAQKQVYIAMENALLGAKALGFDSCPMEGFSAEEYTKILDLPEYLVPSVVVPVGIAADEARKKIRFDKSQIFF